MKIGIIGGSGLEKLKLFSEINEVKYDTQYGDPSSTLFEGKFGALDVAILSRHGRDHSISPSRVNNRANIDALKQAGCSHIIATTACGSLREEIGRGDMVILDQFIDFTKHRINTFFEDFSGGNIQHQAMADPFNEDLRNKLISACKVNDIKHHTTGTMVTIEGPRFSTRAESHMFRAWGADVINMTTATEAALANEAAIPYAAIAMSTDYDCWKTDEDPVSMDDVFKVFKENASKITKILEYIIREWK